MTGEVIYEGKAKKLLTTEDPHVLEQLFKDEATAFNAEKKATFAGKGVANCAISAALFSVVAEAGVPTHFLRQTAPDRMLVRRVEIVPLEVVVRYVVAGSLARRTGLPEGRPVEPPIVEFYYKDDELGDPLLNRDHVRLLGLADDELLGRLRGLALVAGEALRRHFAEHGLRLVDVKFEFGRDAATGELLLADEISPDTMRVWSASGEKLDKDRFRFDLGDLLEGYRQVAEGLGVELPQDGDA